MGSMCFLLKLILNVYFNNTGLVMIIFSPTSFLAACSTKAIACK